MGRWITPLLTMAALALPGTARAGLVPVQVSVTPDAGMYRYTYAIVLPTDAVLQPGNYFTIYNFDGYAANTATASGSLYSGNWTATISTNAQTPPGITPVASTGIPDLTWTYNGPVININASIGLGNFWADSLYPTTTQSWFTSSTGTISGVPDNNITQTTVPVPTAPPPGVPEPATLLLAGLGLPLIAAYRPRRGKASA